MFLKNPEKYSYTLTLVDSDMPDYKSEEYIRDFFSVDGTLLITQHDHNDTRLRPDAMLWATPYTRHEVKTIHDIKVALSLKSIFLDECYEESVILSEISESDTFISLFGDRSVNDLSGVPIAYYVKGKPVKVSASEFFEKVLA